MYVRERYGKRKGERKKKEVHRQLYADAFHLILCSSSEKAVSLKS